ncbi:MAG TPA: ATP-dependent Clp protease adapter ClpS [Verrucomicrobiae bacterium]|nr:ATP-dependent Clp protease adapter ClpS [Verrucomicrobiae bacterium]
MAAIETLPEIQEHAKEKIEEAFEKGWNVIVWNDPINLMTYVVFVFMKVLAFNKEKATKHMLEVHQNGKSIVATETREKAELYHQQIQAHGLMVTIEQVQ